MTWRHAENFGGAVVPPGTPLAPPLYDVNLWGHKQRTPNTNDHTLCHWMKSPHENFLRTPLVVGYFPPTYVAARIGKYSSSTAMSHGLEFETLSDFKIEGITRSGLIHWLLCMGPRRKSTLPNITKVGILHFAEHNFWCLVYCSKHPRTKRLQGRPVARNSQQGGQKSQRGGTFFKHNFVNMKWGGRAPLAPGLATALLQGWTKNGTDKSQT